LQSDILKTKMKVP